MKINNTLTVLLLLICLLIEHQLIANPTYVYVHNSTSLHFDVSIDYEGSTTAPSTFWQQGTDTITPYEMADEKSMVLAIDRLLPQGEHVYTVKLVYGAETFYLKQKCISTNILQESELGISLESSCLHDPWYMNNQAKERHEHLLTINGRTILVVYYAYDSNNCENIEYTLYEKILPSIELETHTHICGKTLTYSLAIPIIKNSATQPNVNKLTHIAPKLLQYLVHNVNFIQSTYQEDPAFRTSQFQSLDMSTQQSDILNERTPIQPASSPDNQLIHDVQNVTDAKQIQAHTISGQKILDYIAHQESSYSIEDSTKTTRFWVPKNKTGLPIKQ